MTIEVRLTIPLAEARLALLAAMDDYRPVLDEWGAVLTYHSQQAFQDQAFGEFAWPPRYYGKGEPFINVAGALEDLRTGPRVAGHRFDKRPALIDRGGLQSSITWNVLGPREVQYGSPRDYAQGHQSGGESAIQISTAMRQNLYDWLREGDNARFTGRLSFAFWDDEYRFQLIPRPFVGVTDLGRQDLIGALEMYLADAVRGAA